MEKDKIINFGDENDLSFIDETSDGFWFNDEKTKSTLLFNKTDSFEDAEKHLQEIRTKWEV